MLTFSSAFLLLSLPVSPTPSLASLTYSFQLPSLLPPLPPPPPPPPLSCSLSFPTPPPSCSLFPLTLLLLLSLSLLLPLSLHLTLQGWWAWVGEWMLKLPGLQDLEGPATPPSPVFLLPFSPFTPRPPPAGIWSHYCVPLTADLLLLQSSCPLSPQPQLADGTLLSHTNQYPLDIFSPYTQPQITPFYVHRGYESRVVCLGIFYLSAQSSLAVFNRVTWRYICHLDRFCQAFHYSSTNFYFCFHCTCFSVPYPCQSDL
jgi:hypothetical protein